MRKIVKQFKVFGEPVNVLVTSEESGRSFAVIHQTSPPGGGPPPHIHYNEDEVFTVIEGEFEIFDGLSWHKLAQGETAHALRGQVHTFRNCGSAAGTIQAIVIPGTGMDEYLEEISVLTMPADALQLKAISDRYGIEFIASRLSESAPT